MNPRRRWNPPALALLALATSGCGHAWGPEEMPTTAIVGRIHFGDQEVTRGWLEIVPVDGTRGRLRSAPIRADGSFRAERVPVGRVAIRLAGPPLPVGQGHPFEDFRRQYLIRRAIAPAPSPPIDIDLWAERREWERLRRGGT